MSTVQDPDWESFLRGLAQRWDGYGGGEKLAQAVAEIDRLRAELAATHVAPKHLLVGDRVETADGARATVTGSAPRGPRGEPAVNLDWDGDAGGPAYEHDLARVPRT